MRAQIIKFYKILLDTDNSLCFTHYKLTTNEDPETGEIITNSTAVLGSPKELPSSITALGKFFDARPNSKGGAIWVQVRFIHNEDIDNIIADTREDFKEQGAQLMVQSIQHYDVAPL